MPQIAEICRKLVHGLFKEELEASEVVERGRGFEDMSTLPEDDLPYRADIDGD